MPNKCETLWKLCSQTDNIWRQQEPFAMFPILKDKFSLLRITNIVQNLHIE